jgi:hypothetical protein
VPPLLLGSLFVLAVDTLTKAKAAAFDSVQIAAFDVIVQTEHNIFERRTHHLSSD